MDGDVDDEGFGEVRAKWVLMVPRTIKTLAMSRDIDMQEALSAD